MKIGFIGLGKLGVPVATVMASMGHAVTGYDIHPPNFYSWPNEEVASTLGERQYTNLAEYLREPETKKPTIAKAMLDAVLEQDIVFIAVQTPHDERFEGDRPVNLTEAVDFDYSYVLDVLERIRPHVRPEQLVVLISTVAPGTFDSVLKDKVGNMRFVYNPSFIAMGTVVPDFLRPEYVLIGARDKADAEELSVFYRSITASDCRCMSIPSAEIVKMGYNCAIGGKIVLANYLGEMCSEFGGDADDVMDAIKAADKRLISRSYLTPGMGDGGGCHPRDALVLSALAQKHGISFDFGGHLMDAREAQTHHMAMKVIDLGKMHSLPIVLLGRAFKPGTRLTNGSPAILLKHLIEAEGGTVSKHHDPMMDGDWRPTLPAVFVIACRHPEFSTWQFPAGSVVVDPHRYVADQRANVVVHRLGAGARLT